MYYVGDVVLHGDNICVALSDGGDTIAVNDGTTRSNVSSDELTLLRSYRDVIKDFRRSILACNPVTS